MATALLLDRRHVHYLTGYWHASGNTVVAAVIPAEGPVTLLAPGRPEGTAADACLTYQAAKLCTLVDDQTGELLRVAAPLLDGRVGCDVRLTGTADLLPILYALRRTKDADEVAMLRQAIACCDAAYARAKALLQPGVSEMHLYAEMLAAASEAAEEPIGEFGNDFQSGNRGGLPRPRAIEAGEMAIYDLTVIYRGYACDLCRSFVVGGRPSAAQQEAYRLISAALDYVEATVKPGVSCRALFRDVFAMLDGQHGWRFHPPPGPRYRPEPPTRRHGSTTTGTMSSSPATPSPPSPACTATTSAPASASNTISWLPKRASSG